MGIMAASLQCNGFEYSYLNGDGSSGVVGLPADACIPNSDGSQYSFKLTCSASYGGMKYQDYESSDCRADTLWSTDTAQLELSGFNKHIVCDQAACNVIRVRVYDQTFANRSECNQFDRVSHAGFMIDEMYVDNYCNTIQSWSELYQCTDGMVTQSTYFNQQCTDELMWTPKNISLADNQCISDVDQLRTFVDGWSYKLDDDRVYAVDVSCESAAVLSTSTLLTTSSTTLATTTTATSVATPFPSTATTDGILEASKYKNAHSMHVWFIVGGVLAMLLLSAVICVIMKKIRKQKSNIEYMNHIPLNDVVPATTD